MKSWSLKFEILNRYLQFEVANELSDVTCNDIAAPVASNRIVLIIKFTFLQADFVSHHPVTFYKQFLYNHHFNKPT